MDSECERDEKTCLAEVIAAVKSQGAAGLSAVLKSKLEDWKSASLNVGVTGTAGVGKSTFINTIRRVNPDDLLAAPVGETQTTKKPTPYKHPRNPNVVFWDLPGAGTPDFPRARYLELVNFTTYDFFIIISCNRFTEDDLWLAKEAQKNGKKFYFARSRMDEAVANDKYNKPRTHNESLLVKEIRDNCIEGFAKAGLGSARVYLICRNEQLFDFEELELTFIRELPVLKRQAVLFSIKSCSVAIVKEKAKILKVTASVVALACAAVAAAPVPCLSFGCDLAIIVTWINVAKKVFGLDPESLKELSLESGVPNETLGALLSGYNWLTYTRVEFITKLLAEYCTQTAVEQFARYIPIIGTVAACIASFTTVMLVLINCIGCMESVAINIIETICAKNA